MKTKLTALAFAAFFLSVSAFKTPAQQAGSFDSSFNAHMSYPTVKRMARLPDNRIVIGGPFSKGIARLGSTGALDSTFNPGAGLDQPPLAIVIQNDGKTLLGGTFTNVSGMSCAGLARLNFDGTADLNFSANLGPGANNAVQAMAVQPDQKILVGGDFTSFNAQTCRGLLRLMPDGSCDASFSIGAGFTSTNQLLSGSAVRSIVLQPDQKILVAGGFTSFGQTKTMGIARLNADGSLDNGFNCQITRTNSGAVLVNAMTLQADGKILIGGDFQLVNGIVRKNVARLNADGSLDSTFNPGTGTDSPVFTLAIQADGSVLLGGSFHNCNGASEQCLVCVNGGGGLVWGLGSALGSFREIDSLLVQNDGKIICGGNFYLGYPNNGQGVIRLYGAPAAAGAPSVILQPVDEQVQAGESVALLVDATGSSNRLQWMFNGNPLAGATGPVLAYPLVATNQAGSYSAVVSNSLGAVTSRIAFLTVRETAPWFAIQPPDVSTNAGNAVTLSALARGLPSYQWFFEGGALAGMTDASFTLQSSLATDSGHYYLVASNSSGSATSRVASVTVTEIPPAITLQPQDVSVLFGAPAALSVTATGAPAPSFQWSKNGTNISGATSSILSWSQAHTEDAGAYSVTVSNRLNVVVSRAATLSVGSPTYLNGAWSTNVGAWVTGSSAPWIVQTSVSHDGGDALQSAAIGDSAQTFVETQVAGPGVISFWWKVSSEAFWDTLQFVTNGVLVSKISGEVDWQFVQVSLPAGSLKLQWVYSKDSFMSAGQDKAWLDQVVFTPCPAVTLGGPGMTNVLQRGYATLNGSIGDSFTAIQWRLNGVDIPGATNLSLALTNFQASDAGSYTLFASGSGGTAVSSNVVLTLRPIVQSQALRLLWQKPPGSVSWMPIETNAYTYRGLACNPVNGHVLVASRAVGTNVYVLDGNTGEELYALDATGISGGIYGLNMIAAAADGAIYACNLTTDSPNVPFKLYRWPSDAVNVAPTLAWQGDPSSGSGRTRWGDSIDVRGAGDQTQILLGGGFTSGAGRQVAILTLAGGSSSPALTLLLASFSANNTVAAFGPGDRLWCTDRNPPNIFQYSFAGGVATLLKSYSPQDFSWISTLAVDPAEHKLAALTVDYPDNVRLYDVAPGDGALAELDTEFFVPPYGWLNGYATGSLAFAPGRLYALDSENGIVAFKLAPTLQVQSQGSGLTLSWTGDYRLQSAGKPEGPYQDVTGASSPYSVEMGGQALFFRVVENNN